MSGRSHSLTVAALAACAALTGKPVEAQDPNPPASVTVRGRVIAAESGSPVPYAIIQVENGKKWMRTDIDGQFAVELQAGATLSVSKAGFVRSEQVPSMNGTSDIRLVRAGALSGRVTDEFGDPIVAAPVTVSAAGLRRSPTLTATTDDRGEYRIGGLPPGTYRAAVQTNGTQEVSSTSADRAGRGAGAPVPGMTLLRSITTTTYFPDVVDSDRAIEIALQAGSERTDIDIHVPLALASRQATLLRSGLSQIVDTRPPLENGGTIRGVVRDSSGRALPYAQVTLEGVATSTGPVLEATALMSTYRTSTTNELGEYEFGGLRNGLYAVQANKPGYATPPPQPAGPPPPAAMSGVREGRTAARDFTLVKWGAVTGRVRDDYGDPVHGAMVTLLQMRYDRGRRRLAPVPVAPRATNDRGEFRIFAVPPGEYVVMARTPDDAFDVSGYATTFYPGVLVGSEARSISLGLGGEADGVDFALVAAPTVRVSGRTLDSSGTPTTQLRLSLMSKDNLTAPLQAAIEADGSFALENVPPGPYVLRADAGRTNTFTEGEFVALPLVVGASDVTDLVVQAAPGSTITGRFVFDRSVAASDPPASAVAISAIPADPDAAPDFIASTQANAVGVFQLRGITGQRRLQVTRVPPAFMVSSILVNGRDVIDEPMPFGLASESLDDVQVVLTDRVTRLSVRVMQGQQPVPAGVHVVIFSADPARLYPLSRYYQHHTTGSDGGITLTGLPPGNYFAAAARTIPAGDTWQDPAYLDSLLGTATVIAVSEGDNSAVIRLPN